MFYTFIQNNSGGDFVINDDVAQYVIIEADNANQANEIALKVGIYFDGTCGGPDCPCCGDRWSSVSERDTSESPSIYGDNPTNDEFWTSKYHKEKLAIIYYKDGKKESYSKPHK
jgi:hypothetical protein